MPRYYYIDLNEENIVVGICDLKGPVDFPSYRQVDSYDEAMLGNHYNDETGKITFIQRYQTVMDAKAFLLELSPDELKRFRASTDPLIEFTHYLFSIRNGEVNTESDIFKDVMQAARDENIISAARAKELSKGRPV